MLQIGERVTFIDRVLIEELEAPEAMYILRHVGYHGNPTTGFFRSFILLDPITHHQICTADEDELRPIPIHIKTFQPNAPATEVIKFLETVSPCKPMYVEGLDTKLTVMAYSEVAFSNEEAVKVWNKRERLVLQTDGYKVNH